ncbi:MAG TPA: tetratricopeptide repeat protein, partial [Egibacteraceae bacterium]|nr:tetratricopeptide repeat protein [Egibacteraceae bacterium]
IAEHGRVDELPETVQGIIAARLDGVERDEKRLLQDAAVVGKVFWSGALAAMSGEPRTAVEERLHALERRQFVRRERRSSVAGETEYAFRHILVRDVAYGQIPRAERADRHARAASWIESLGRTGDTAELLAQHYLAAIELARAAGVPAERYTEGALAALRVASERAMSLNAFPLAARYFRGALDLMDEDDPARPRILFGYGKALRFSEERGADVLAEAERALRARGDAEAAAEASVLQAELAWFRGDGKQAAAHLARATELVDELPASYSKAYVLSDLSRYHMLAGRREEALRLGRQALAIAEELRFEEIRAHALNNIGTLRVDQGDTAGMDDLELAREIATTVNSPELARVLNNMASASWMLGQTKRADELWREALARARELGNASVERFVRAHVPNLDIRAGAWDAALRALDEFIAEAEAAGGHVQEANARESRAGIRFARDDVAGALNDTERALDAARRAGDPQALLPALESMVWLLMELGRRDEAEPLLEELLAHPHAAEYMGVGLALALVELGRLEDLRRLVDEFRSDAWRAPLAPLLSGDLVEAADRHEAMGMLPLAALLRQTAARHLVEQGELEAARPPLAAAMAFWRRVAARRRLREGEELMARVAAAESGGRSRARRRRPRSGGPSAPVPP